MPADKQHWILKVMNQVTDPAFYDGVILGIAGAAVVVVAALGVTGNL